MRLVTRPLLAPLLDGLATMAGMDTDERDGCAGISRGGRSAAAEPHLLDVNCVGIAESATPGRPEVGQ